MIAAASFQDRPADGDARAEGGYVFTAFPAKHWQKIWSTNPQRINDRDARRRKSSRFAQAPSWPTARRMAGPASAGIPPLRPL